MANREEFYNDTQRGLKQQNQCENLLKIVVRAIVSDELQDKQIINVPRTQMMLIKPKKRAALLVMINKVNWWVRGNAEIASRKTFVSL